MAKKPVRGAEQDIDPRLSDEDLDWAYRSSGPASFGALRWERPNKALMVVHYKPGTAEDVAERHQLRIQGLLESRVQDLR